MDSDFHSAAFSDTDQSACRALPSESGLEMLVRMPDLGLTGEICAGAAASVSGERVREALDLGRG